MFRFIKFGKDTYKSVGHINIVTRCVVCGTVTCGFKYFGRIPDPQISVELRAYKIVRRLVEIGKIEPKCIRL